MNNPISFFKNILNFLKKYWYLALLVFALIASIIIKFPSLKETALPPQTSYQNITPGQTSTTQLFDTLGQPLNQSSQYSYTIYDYPSEFALYPTKIYSFQDKVVFIREPIKNQQNLSFTSINKTLGSPQAKLKDPNLGPSVTANIYPQNGAAYFASDSDNLIVEIWYFQPSSLETFLSTWGKNLVTSYSTPQDKILP